MQEPEVKEDAANETRGDPPAIPFESYADKPKAYAFDGWSMVPIEPVTA